MSIDFGKFYTYGNFLVRGWFSDEHIGWYQSEAKKIFDGTIVEIGVYCGLSLLSIVDICKQNNTKIIGIDPWDKIEVFHQKPIDEEFIEIRFPIIREGYNNLLKILAQHEHNHVSLIQDFSLSVARNIECDLDLVFIDGNHFDVYNDLVAWHSKTKTIAGHDFNSKEVKEDVEKFCKEYNFKYTIPTDNIFKIVIKQ